MVCKPFFRLFPKRYFLALLSFIIVLLQISMRTVFTLVIVHLTSAASNSSYNDTHVTPSNSTNQCALTEDEVLSWSDVVHAQALTAYFYGYVLTQIPGGILSQRFAAYKVFGISCLTSFILFLIIPVVMYKSWEAVILIRLLQGLVEGVSLPAMNGVLTHWARTYEKTRIVTIMASGAYLSSAVGLGVTGVMICSVGWHAPFFLFSGTGIFFCLVWLATIRESPLTDQMIGTLEKGNFMRSVTGRAGAAGSGQAQSVPWRAIFTSLPVSAIFVASFCRCWIFFLLLTEQPQYFLDVFKFNVDEIGYLSALPHIFMTIVVLIGGVSADMFIAKQILSRTTVRKLYNCGGFAVEAAALLALSFIPSDQPMVAVVVLIIGVGFSGFAISGYQVNPHDLAPERASILSGVAKLGSIAGIIMPPMVAELTKNATAGEWDLVFRISAGLHFAGVLYYAMFASGELQPWSMARLVEESINKADAAREANEDSVEVDSVEYDETSRILPNTINRLVYSSALFRSTDLGQ